jgi:hypothetical protein
LFVENRSEGLTERLAVLEELEMIRGLICVYVDTNLRKNKNKKKKKE